MTQNDTAQMLANRLKKNLKHLAKWRKREHVDCYRLYDADIPEFALAIDIYTDVNNETWAHVQEYEAPKHIDAKKVKERLDNALLAIKDALSIGDAHLHLKVRQQQKGLKQYEKVDSQKQFIQVQENGNLFWINLTDYLDTGLFLDHRTTRKLLTTLLQNMNGEKSFLNLFAYTGSATVYAAKGGATQTTTVDMSNTYLNWAKRNLHSNGFTGDQHEFIQSDCLQWLQSPAYRKKYDLIFLDPPSFSTSKRMKSSFDIQRDHVSLIRDAVKLLKPEGVLVFSNNLRTFKMAKEELEELNITNISHQTLPNDYARNPKIHNCWKITR